MTSTSGTAPALTARDARRCYNGFSLFHAAFYFAPEHDRELGALGLEGGSAAYFAGRAAPMGAVGAGVVTAAFYSFSPRLVASVMPQAWEKASPAAVLAARERIVDGYLRRLLGAEAVASPEMAEAAGLALEAVRGCGTGGARPLFAANAALPVPDAPHLALWHATTVLREHRGDGHLIALADAGLDGLEALVTHTATGKGFTPQFNQASRGWSAGDWAAAEERLRERGLLDGSGDLTPEGVAQRKAVEEATDRLALAPYRHLGEAGTARLGALLSPMSSAMVDGGAFPLQHLGRG